jgi:hypothetical protein
MRIDMDRLQRGIATLLNVYAPSSSSSSSLPSAPLGGGSASTSIMSMPPLASVATSINQMVYHTIDQATRY